MDTPFSQMRRANTFSAPTTIWKGNFLLLSHDSSHFLISQPIRPGPNSSVACPWRVLGLEA